MHYLEAGPEGGHAVCVVIWEVEVSCVQTSKNRATACTLFAIHCYSISNMSK
jgi:hypothetical protein